MANLSTKYMGLTLNNPIIVGSSGLTKTVTDMKNAEKNGAGAIVMKSLFEEQIMLDTAYQIKQAESDKMIYFNHSETIDYLDYHLREKELSNYLNQIEEARSKLMIPIIASVHCVTPGEWIHFASRIQAAGANALELNIAILPYSVKENCMDIESHYIDIIKEVKKEVSIPISVKLSPYFSNLVYFANALHQTDVASLVLFNRFFSPDIDIEDFEVISTNLYSSPAEMSHTLRWIAILSDQVKFDLAASTGIHDGETVIKMLLAGAKAAQVNSAIYKYGYKHINTMLETLENWMDRKGFNYVDQFIGKMSHYKANDPSAYERIQFMRYYSEIGL